MCNEVRAGIEWILACSCLPDNEHNIAIVAVSPLSDVFAMLSRNLVSNCIGQAWRALMALAFVPLYISYLGVEAYGLIGFFAVLQSSLGLLDLGLRPALGREMARYTGGAHNEQSIWNLLRSVELVATVIATVVVIGFVAASSWIGMDWVRAQELPQDTVAQTLKLMGLVVGLQLVDAIYYSCLSGLQRQVSQNAVIVASSTARGLGAVGILAWVSPTIQAFFVWQCACALATIVTNRVLVYRLLPKPPLRARFSLASIVELWRFAAGMMAITLLALLLRQTDKVLLSRLLALKVFGYYTLAGVVATSVGVLVGPITAAYYPQFNVLVVGNDQPRLSRCFHQAAQLVSVTAGSVSSVLILLPEQVLMAWTGDRDLASHVAPIMAILTLGTLLNCSTWVPYQLQLAHGWTSLGLWINVAAVSILLPAIFVLVPENGPLAAAWIWVALNTGYLLVGVHFTFRRLLTTEKRIWYVKDVISPIIAAFLPTALATVAFPAQFERVWGGVLLISIGVASFGVAIFATPLTRDAAKRLFERYQWGRTTRDKARL